MQQYLSAKIDTLALIVKYIYIKNEEHYDNY